MPPIPRARILPAPIAVVKALRALLAVLSVVAFAAGGCTGLTASARAAGVGSFLQGGSSSSKSELDTLISKARKDGSTVVVINPDGKKAAADDASGMSMMHTNAMLLEARYNLIAMIHNSGKLPEIIAGVIAKASPDGSYRWLLNAVATALGGILFGLGVYKLITRYIRKTFASRRQETNPTRARKLRYLLLRALLLLMSSVVMFALTVFVAVVFDTDVEATRITILNIVAGYAVYRILRYVIFFNFFAPDVDAFRMIRLDGRRARKLYSDWYRITAFSVVLLGVCQWLYDLGVPKELHSLMFIGASGVCALLVGALAIAHRRDLVEIVRGDARRGKRRRIREAIAKALLPIILFYLAAAWAVSTFRLSLGLRSGYILVAAPILVFIVAIFVYGIAIYALDVIYERREQNFRRRRVLERLKRRREARRAAAASLASDPMLRIVVEDPDDGDGVGDEEEMIVHQPSETPAEREYRPIFKRFFEGAIGASVLVVALGELARLWGVNIGQEGHPLARLLDSSLVIILGLLAFQALNDYIDLKVAEEGGRAGGAPGPAHGDGEGGVGETRLATLLPIFRAMLIGALGIIGVAIVLSNLGVDIAPLFAGAGVVGLAIGFGAQTLIRDVFSGLFFLIDDAFRKGEYIAVGSVQGVIEKISIRSFQLRHHRGALHTVPFGEIQHLTNFSRDWVVMKLPLRVTYGTDVEKVRKLIKQLGQDLLTHPEVGHLFLQPLKSQGVYSMEDSAMIIRVKFMTRPGDQFVARKVVYASIRELFAKEGVEFAHREVTVRLADGTPVSDLTPEQRQAITGSVRSVIDQEEEAMRHAASVTAMDR